MKEKTNELIFHASSTPLSKFGMRLLEAVRM